MNPGRNDPCPCGSGKKYKKCCGAVIPVAPAGESRRCGECTACCDGWVAGTIRGHEMRPGVRCHFVGEGRCTIYEERPVSPCRNFVCGWLAPDSPFPDDFRPDKLGVIVIRVAWRGGPAYLLRSAGRDPDQRLLEWMRAFSVRTGRPFFYEQAGERLGFGPAAFQRDMLEKAERGEPMY
jgi:SEC-C motif-containing protein